MLIVGELINASRKAIGVAIENRDKAAIQKVAVDQHENGTGYIDVNAGIFVDNEAECIKWLVESVQEIVDTPCCIDSPDPKVIEAGLSVHRGTAMINSISLEKKRYEALLPIIAGSDLRVIALCMSDRGMPQTVDDRMAIADELINGLVKNNIAIENIYIDPLVQPLSTNKTYGLEFINAVERIMNTFRGVHTICGLSNISFALPEKKFMNQTFMAMAIAKGLDSAIVNPLDKRMMAIMVTAEALAGKDDYCENYLKAYRSRRLEF